MRRGKEAAVLVVTLAIAAAILVAMYTVYFGGPTSPETATTRQDQGIDAPHQVQENPPGARGTIDEP